MKWYTGTIPEAVAHAQAQKALFCVAIFGDDADSTTLETSLGSADIQELVAKEGVISVKIDASSEEFGQFGAIYPNVTSPSIYCITTGGVAVQVISGALDTPALKARFDVALNLHREAITLTSTSGPSPAPISYPTSVSVTAAASQLPSTSSANAAESPTDLESAESQRSLEERIERAKQLAAAKQQAKREEEAAEARRRENERREAGKKVAELKRWQAEQETKRLADERRKDKLEEAALRQRLREQIAQDRIDRELRIAAEANPAAAVPPPRDPPTVSAPVNYTGKARLQFRLPDGSSHSHAFELENTLQDVRNYLIAQVPVPEKGFSISIAFPRRALTPQDNGTTLRDLGLLPSAALLIIPLPETRLLGRGGGGGATVGVLAMLSAVFQVLVSPFTSLWSWIRPAAQPEVAEGQQTGSSRGQRSIPPRRLGNNTIEGGAEESGVRKRRTEGAAAAAGQSFGRTDGNIHRFPSSHSDSDDEQGTYNGNSTQQM